MALRPLLAPALVFVFAPPARTVGGASNPLANLSPSLSLSLLLDGRTSDEVPWAVFGLRNEEGRTRLGLGIC